MISLFYIGHRIQLFVAQNFNCLGIDCKYFNSHLQTVKCLGRWGHKLATGEHFYRPTDLKKRDFIKHLLNIPVQINGLRVLNIGWIMPNIKGEITRN